MVRFSGQVMCRQGRLAQLVRAPALHAGCRRFESVTAYHSLCMTLWAAAGAVLAGRPEGRSISATARQRVSSDRNAIGCAVARFSPVSTCNFPRRATLQALAAFLN